MLQNDRILLEYAQGRVDENVRAAEMERLGRRLHVRRLGRQRLAAWAGALGVIVAVAGVLVGILH